MSTKTYMEYFGFIIIEPVHPTFIIIWYQDRSLYVFSHISIAPYAPFHLALKCTDDGL